MVSFKNVLAGLVCVAVGVFLSRTLGGELNAQEFQLTEETAWEISHGSYGSSGSDDARFYVVRHNRLTGETQYVGCEDQNECEILYAATIWVPF